jgi:hypothetical protein
VAEKTDKPKQASGRGQARKNAAPAAKRTAKKSARRADKTAAAASKPKKSVARKSETKKPAAKNGRKRAAKAVAEELAMTKEELAARRIAGGQDAETAGSDAAQTQAPNGTRALTAANDDSAPATLGSMPSEPAPAEDQLEAAARNVDSVKPNKTDPRSRAGENAECGPRPNTLVPTNGIHATERRIKRKLYQNRGVMGLIAATLLGIVVLGEQTAPPDTTDFEQEIAASQATDTDTGSRQASSPPGIIKPNSLHDSVATTGPEASQLSERQNKNLSEGELVEMERLLARLDLGPSTADGVVNDQTEAAIRLYQEIAGLPIDGAPSRTLLADMREVVKILEDGG